jgi:hypothetical protein
MDSTILATLLKFTNGKNGKILKEECADPTVAAGSHPVAVTVTLDGFLDRAPDGEQTRTTFPAAADAFSIALSKVNAATRATIVAAVLDVQRGVAFKAPPEVLEALESLTVKKTTPRTGATVFRGHVIIEECDGHVPEDVKGLTVSTWPSRRNG